MEIKTIANIDNCKITNLPKMTATSVAETGTSPANNAQLIPDSFVIDKSITTVFTTLLKVIASRQTLLNSLPSFIQEEAQTILQHELSNTQLASQQISGWVKAQKTAADKLADLATAIDSYIVVSENQTNENPPVNLQQSQELNSLPQELSKLKSQQNAISFKPHDTDNPSASTTIPIIPENPKTENIPVPSQQMSAKDLPNPRPALSLKNIASILKNISTTLQDNAKFSNKNNVENLNTHFPMLQALPIKIRKIAENILLQSFSADEKTLPDTLASKPAQKLNQLAADLELLDLPSLESDAKEPFLTVNLKSFLQEPKANQQQLQLLKTSEEILKKLGTALQQSPDVEISLNNSEEFKALLKALPPEIRQAALKILYRSPLAEAPPQETNIFQEAPDTAGSKLNNLATTLELVSSTPEKTLHNKGYHLSAEFKELIQQYLAIDHDFPSTLKRAKTILKELSASLQKDPCISQKNLADHANFSFSSPIYFGDIPYPCYVQVYQQKKDKTTPETEKAAHETWLRVCLKTENIGIVDLMFHLSNNNNSKSLDLKAMFHDNTGVQLFNDFLPSMRDALQEMNLTISNINTGLVPTKLNER